MNPTPHRRTRVTTAGALRSWFLQPHDYRWMAEFQNSRPTGKAIRWLLAILTLNYGALAMLTLFTPGTPHNPFAIAWKMFLVVMTLAVSAAWITKPFPGRRGVVAFAVFADLGTATSMLTNPISEALLSCALFAVIGTFYTFFLSARWLTAHLTFAVTCTFVAAAAQHHTGDVDTASLILRTNIVLLAISGVPLTSHLLITMLTDDARSSLLDPLTGLLNRRGLDASIDDVWRLGRDENRCAAVLVLDIDRFKSINDKYGHEEGDAVIVRIAERLGSHIGEYGVLARTGGEEYLAVVSTSRMHIDALIDGVRSALRDPADTIAVTASVGAAVAYWDSALWDQDIDVVTRAIRMADSMMYEAKSAGGDRVVTTLL